jgi:O-methyltransferase involved in polyketide biosynthesis
MESAKPNPLLRDPTAVRITAAIDYDFSTIAKNMSPISQLCWIARSLHTDRTVKLLLARAPEATVVNLGCGLDTTFERVDNGRVRWFDLDLPDVIELRDQYIPASGRRRSLASSMLDDEWLPQIGVAAPVLFLASGVLYYFDETEVRTLLIKLADHFPGSEILFDACSPRGMRVANRRVIKAGGMDAAAALRWSIQRASDMEQWDRRISVVAEYPMFRNMRHRLILKEKWGTLMSDLLRIMWMVHLRLGAETSLRSAG